MSCCTEVLAKSFEQLHFEPLEGTIQLHMATELRSPEQIIEQLSSIKEPLDVYCWYEGTQCLPQAGAAFMTERIFRPLYVQKPNAKLYLYSLKAWNFTKDIAQMSPSTPLGKAINRINASAIECIYSSAFFQYCMQMAKNQDFYTFVSQELPKKHWLFALSENRGKKEITVGEFFCNNSSLFNCISDLDVTSAYAAMQYIEGYYLIQESVKKGLLQGQKKISIAFVLPNDEGKYYNDFPQDVEKMLRLDFGSSLKDVSIQIMFSYFPYGDSLNSRPYINRAQKTMQVKPENVEAYFHYLFERRSHKAFIPRDIIHNLY